MQDLAAVSYAVCAPVGGPKNVGRGGGDAGPRPFGTGVWLTLETRSYATCATTPNFVVLVQTVWAGGPKNLRDAGPRLPCDRALLPPRINTLLSHVCYVPNFVASGQCVIVPNSGQTFRA